jgi:hypothetical protein
VRYRGEVRAAIQALRIGGYLAIALGIGQSIRAYVVDESVNAAGIVPGVAIGFGLISVGAYVLMAAGYLRAGSYWSLAFPATLTVLVTWSTAMLVAEQVAIATVTTFGDGVSGMVVLVGFFANVGTVCMLLFILPVLLVLAWIADRFAWLRSRGVGDGLRRSTVPPMFRRPRSRDET